MQNRIIRGLSRDDLMLARLIFVDGVSPSQALIKIDPIPRVASQEEPRGEAGKQAQEQGPPGLPRGILG